MANPFTMSMDVHYKLSVPNASEFKPKFFHKTCRYPLRKFTILCNSSKSPSNLEETQKSSSLSDQLKPLTATILSKNAEQQAQLINKPSKSAWVNPTKPKRPVLSILTIFKLGTLSCLQRTSIIVIPLQKKLSFQLLIYPTSNYQRNALLMLNSLEPWDKTFLFFNLVKTRNFFPMETIFYNVTIKSLRFGRKFELIEGLANEMVDNGIQVDKITYSMIIICAKRCNLFGKAVEWFERMYKTHVMPDEVTYSAILDMYAKLGKIEEVMSLYDRRRASGWTPDHIAFSVLCKMFGEAGDYDGIKFVLQEMSFPGLQPNLMEI